VLGLAVSAASGYEGSTRRPKSCFPAHSQTLAATRRVRVFEKYDSDFEDYYVWACLKRQGTAYMLGANEAAHEDLASGEGEGISLVRIAGSFVAFDDTFNDHYGDYQTIIVSRDVRTGRTAHRWAPSPGQCPTLYEVEDLELSRHGGIGWLAKRWNCGRTGPHQVFKEDRTPRTTVLDRTADGAPLTLRHGSLIWRHAGKPRRARLR
jgi:hypothetical protein